MSQSSRPSDRVQISGVQKEKKRRRMHSISQGPPISCSKAASLYGLTERDLKWLGRPALDKPKDRKYDKAELAHMAALKDECEQCQILNAPAKNFGDRNTQDMGTELLAPEEMPKSTQCLRKSARLALDKMFNIRKQFSLTERDVYWLAALSGADVGNLKYNDRLLQMVASLKERFEKARSLEKCGKAKARRVKRDATIARKSELSAAEDLLGTARLAKDCERAMIYHGQCKQMNKYWHTIATYSNEMQHSPDYSNSPLPFDLWMKVMMTLCDDLEINGIRGISVIARELSLAARVNKEFYAASLPAFKHLSNLCPSLDSLLPNLRNETEAQDASQAVSSTSSASLNLDSSIWDALVADPRRPTALEIKLMYTAMGFNESQPKDVMAFELMAHFKLMHPTPLPARLIFAVLAEKKEQVPVELGNKLLRVGPPDFEPLYGLYAGEKRLIDVREECFDRGICTMSDLKFVTDTWFNVFEHDGVFNSLMQSWGCWESSGRVLNKLQTFVLAWLSW